MEVMEGGDSAPKRMTIVKSHDVIKIVRYLLHPITYNISSDNKAFYVNKDVACISKHLATILQSKQLITTSILKVGSRRANQKLSTWRLRPKFLRFA